MAILRYPSYIGTGSYPLLGHIQINEFIRTTRLADTPGSTINLYMPQKVDIPNTISWNATELGSFYGLGTGADGSSGSELAATLTSAMGPLGEWMSGWATKIMGFVNGITQNSMAQAATARVPNPNLTLLFRGVNFRQFRYSFMLYPYNQSEATDIYNIVKTIRMGALPELSAGGMLFKYPNEYEISYMFEGSPNPWLHKFKRCAITDITIDYTGAGIWTMTRDGFPTYISLTLQFDEIEIVTRKDVDNGY